MNCQLKLGRSVATAFNVDRGTNIVRSDPHTNGVGSSRLISMSPVTLILYSDGMSNDSFDFYWRMFPVTVNRHRPSSKMRHNTTACHVFNKATKNM